MKQYRNPKITIAGAGPGDPDLISVKALKAIQSADVVLYDALVNPQLLMNTPKGALIIFVGKRKGTKAYPQEQINTLMVDYAFTHGHVVRLKGGDPFVFGRGMEEALFAEKFNIPVEIIPGISSSIAVPALAGIPVSHRGTANSFWVLTATLSDGSINPDLQCAAKSNATVVVLMGLGKLREIAGIFEKAGKENEAAAVVSNGSLPTQKAAFGTVTDICCKVADEGISAPAVIVIGEVVRLRHQSDADANHSAALQLLEKIKSEMGLDTHSESNTTGDVE